VDLGVRITEVCKDGLGRLKDETPFAGGLGEEEARFTDELIEDAARFVDEMAGFKDGVSAFEVVVGFCGSAMATAPGTGSKTFK
jgi:hypothetical protein